MHVVATAGHVDHGKSALVRALTGIDPDRWAEEHRRGLTIDLGYAWTTLESGEEIAFVDVPGHRRFIGNMLAGLGPAPAVLLVVAADEGWRRQSAEHLAAVDALGLEHGLLVVTRADLADPRTAMAEAREQLAGTSLSAAEPVAVSARTGAGLDALRARLARLVGELPAPPPDARLRLWIDRSFSVTGTGTVVTGTLEAGRLRRGDRLRLSGSHDDTVTVRALQTLGRSREEVVAPARVAVALRGVAADEVARGEALLAVQGWEAASRFDVRLRDDAAHLPTHLTLHLGTAAVPARLRPLAGDAARVTIAAPLPLTRGDRALLRDPSDDSPESIVGLVVVDVDPPELRRRGDAARRGVSLSRGRTDAAPGLGDEVARRGAMRVADALRLRLLTEDSPATDLEDAEIARYGAWLVADGAWLTWRSALEQALTDRIAGDPLEPSLTLEAARAAAGVPDVVLLEALAASAGLSVERGRVRRPGVVPDLGAAEAGLRAVEERLGAAPWDAPEQHDLDAAGLGPRQLAAAEGLGRLLRLGEGVVVRPDAPARAMRVLAGLPQPFTTSQARQALSTTRRVAVPLLEHLDGRGWTRRLDAGHREVLR